MLCRRVQQHRRYACKKGLQHTSHAHFPEARGGYKRFQQYINCLLKHERL